MLPISEIIANQLYSAAEAAPFTPWTERTVLDKFISGEIPGAVQWSEKRWKLMGHKLIEWRQSKEGLDAA